MKTKLAPILLVILIAAFVIPLFAACASSTGERTVSQVVAGTDGHATDAAGTSNTPDYTDFIGKRIAVKNGSIYDAISTELMEASAKLMFEDCPSIYEAVTMGKADASMRNYRAAYVSLAGSQYTGWV